MRPTRLHVATFVLLSTAACKSGGGDAANVTDAGDAADVGVDANDDSAPSDFDATQPEIVSIAITPADPVVEVLDGKLPSAITFQAVGTLQGGATTPVSGQWSFDRPDVGTLDGASGSFAATGLLGGKGTVTFKSAHGTATTSAKVKLHYTSDPQSIDASIKSKLASATTTDSSLAWLYPYDGTVFPRGLVGPTLQWNGGGVADVYYLHLTSDTFEYETWTTVPPPSRWSFPATPDDIWKKLTLSTTGAVNVALQRYDGTQAYLAKSQGWTIAPANLAGTVYYWEVNNGNVVRLKMGESAPKDFLQKPAGATCVACHSVSKNGATLVASFNGSASPWGTFDTASGSSRFVYGTDPYDATAGSGYQAISPDGAYVLWGQERQVPYLSLSPSNAKTELAQLEPGTGFPVHPAWSGDGAKIAFAVRTDGNWLDFTNATLWMSDVSGTSFSNVKMIVPNDPTRTAVTFPTFGPDSKWIAFERSTQARSRGALSDVWLASADGATVIALDRANGNGVLQGNDASSTYEPTFMPLSAGGYFWLVVVSERTYGNTLTDTNRTTRHKQLWVTAIDASPQAGKDPSHPAFWLPGQETTDNNMRGEWALDPCKQVGQSCTSGFECCNGFCRGDGDGGFACATQVPSCGQLGEACKTASDCCDGTNACIGGFCANPPVN